MVAAFKAPVEKPKQIHFDALHHKKSSIQLRPYNEKYTKTCFTTTIVKTSSKDVFFAVKSSETKTIWKQKTDKHRVPKTSAFNISI